LIPTILDRLSEISKPPFEDGACKFMAREFFPLLADWGLLEGIYKQSSTDISYPNQLESVRITPLFDQILHFDLNLVSDEVEPFFSADDIPGMIIDSEAEERHNRIIADKIIQVVETGLDDFIACEEDCASVFRLAIAFWNDAVASKYPNPPVLRSDIENRMFHELTGPSFEFADSEAMNFIDQMRKNWKRLCSHDTRVITGHKLNLNGNGPSLSVLTIDLEEEG